MLPQREFNLEQTKLTIQRERRRSQLNDLRNFMQARPSGNNLDPEMLKNLEAIEEMAHNDRPTQEENLIDKDL